MPTLTLFALVACSQAPSPTPSAPTVPRISNLETRAPARARVGEKITVQSTYTPSAGCWRMETTLAQPDELTFVETTNHYAGGSDCLSGEVSTLVEIPLSEPGELTFTVILDGVTVSKHSVQVEPAQ